MPRQRRRHRRKRRSNLTKTAVIVAAVLAVPLLGWTAIAMVGDDDQPEASPTTTPTQQTGDENHGGHGSTTPGTNPSVRPAAPTEDIPTEEPSSGDDADVAVEHAIEACSIQLTAGKAVVSEANTGVGHWFEHIQARTDLLEDRNTQGETKAIWKRTRLAGPDDLDRFAAVLSTYNKLSGCDDLAELEAPTSMADDATACLDRSTVTAKAVSAATDAIGDWSNHLDDMARHADGHMTAAEAQDHWVEAWENAPTNINAFNDAQDDLEQAPACTAADE